MNKQKLYLDFILYMKMKGTKKKLLNDKKWISKNFDSTSYIIWKWSKGKKNS
jgi:hypothetical protein